MRSSSLLVAAAAVLLVACGGKTFGEGIGDPDGGSGGSSSGGGSSGAGSGGSGGSGGSSGAGSGGSGGSSSGGASSSSSGGGHTCTPLPGCSSTTFCPAGDGCNTCTCENGQWGCTMMACATDASAPVCPPTPPQGGTKCAFDGMKCDGYPGCSPQCTCSGGLWQCIYPPCPPPICPPNAPKDGSSCGPVGNVCDYPINQVCQTMECTCDPSSTWGCTPTSCIDGGMGPD